MGDGVGWGPPAGPCREGLGSVLQEGGERRVLCRRRTGLAERVAARCRQWSVRVSLDVGCLFVGGAVSSEGVRPACPRRLGPGQTGRQASEGRRSQGLPEALWHFPSFSAEPMAPDPVVWGIPVSPEGPGSQFSRSLWCCCSVWARGPGGRGSASAWGVRSVQASPSLVLSVGYPEPPTAAGPGPRILGGSRSWEAVFGPYLRLTSLVGGGEPLGAVFRL